MLIKTHMLTAVEDVSLEGRVPTLVFDRIKNLKDE